jgi:hypothetical protein
VPVGIFKPITGMEPAQLRDTKTGGYNSRLELKFSRKLFNCIINYWLLNRNKQ